MADFKDVIDFFMVWEGGLSRDTKDSASRFPCPTEWNHSKGWHTNKGITYATWVNYFGKDRDDEFFNMTREHVEHIFKVGYWDKVKGDEIDSYAIAACLVSWAWGSGSKTAIKMIQKIVGTKVDGVIGSKTLKAINSKDEKELFDECIEARRKFFLDISKDGTPNAKFRRGWLRRLDAFEKEFKPN